jgi:hypothetical protein
MVCFFVLVTTRLLSKVSSVTTWMVWYEVRTVVISSGA